MDTNNIKIRVRDCPRHIIAYDVRDIARLVIAQLPNDATLSDALDEIYKAVSRAYGDDSALPRVHLEGFPKEANT